MESTKHFEITIKKGKYGFKLTKENYAIIDNKSSFSKGIIYSDEWCCKHYQECMKNYEKNMQYFSRLNKTEFENSLNLFLKKNNMFKEIEDLNLLTEKSGYYIMVLDEYKQIYIGTSQNISQRIKSHWQKRVPFDRVIFGTVENSIISIDSFRSLDTTRIFVYITNDIYDYENKFIDDMPKEYVLNRTIGGKLENGLNDAIMYRKSRNFEENILSSSTTTENYYTITDLMKILKCSRYKIMQYYNEEDLPLIKNKNNYIVNKHEFNEWLEIKKEREEIQEIYMLATILLILFMFMFLIFFITII